MIKVNLLAASPGAATPRDWLPREQRSAVAGLAMLLATAVGIGGWWYSLHIQRTRAEQRIAVAERELVRLKDAAGLVEKATAKKTELAERLGLIDRLRAAKREPVSLLETVSRSVPDGLWLVDLKQTGNSLQVDGRALSLTSVTDFAERLQNSGLFKRPVEILTTSTETLEDTTVIRFSVKADAADPALPAGASTAPSSSVAGNAAPGTGA